MNGHSIGSLSHAQDFFRRQEFYDNFKFRDVHGIPLVESPEVPDGQQPQMPAIIKYSLDDLSSAESALESTSEKSQDQKAMNSKNSIASSPAAGAPASHFSHVTSSHPKPAPNTVADQISSKSDSNGIVTALSNIDRLTKMSDSLMSNTMNRISDPISTG